MIGECCVWQKYKEEGRDTIILAGAEYGSGSSRDWAAKGPFLLVRVAITSAHCVSSPSFFKTLVAYQKSQIPLYILSVSSPALETHLDQYSSSGAFDLPETRILTVPFLYLQGVKAVIAKSFERIHRSNLVGMGLIPLCFKDGEDAESLGLTGFEKFTIDMPDLKDVKPGMDITVRTDNNKEFTCVLRFDTQVELTYFSHGGILLYVLRQLLNN